MSTDVIVIQLNFTFGDISSKYVKFIMSALLLDISQSFQIFKASQLDSNMALKKITGTK